jgi:hypothetical protein
MVDENVKTCPNCWHFFGRNSQHPNDIYNSSWPRPTPKRREELEIAFERWEKARQAEPLATKKRFWLKFFLLAVAIIIGLGLLDAYWPTFFNKS